MNPEAQRIAIADGMIFGRLTVIEKSHQNQRRNWLWLCRCSCGKTVKVIGADLIRAHTQSCGCFRVETTRRNKTTHGNAKRKQHTKEYRIWRGLLSRCCLATNPAFEDYGGRGIKVCDRWRDSFKNFLADMGRCPVGMGIERTDNDSGYNPSNCKWATPLEQAHNRRKRRWKRKP